MIFIGIITYTRFFVNICRTYGAKWICMWYIECIMTGMRYEGTEGKEHRNMDTQKNYVSNQQDADIFVRQLLNIGEAMYQSGGEISRIENSLHRLGKAYGALHVNVYAITSSILITVEFDENESVTQNRRITRRGSFDCVKMEKLNQLCRDCAACPIEVSELRERVLSILAEKPSLRKFYLGQLIAATTFTLFFGGNGLDALVAGIAVLVICMLQKWVRPVFSTELFFNVTCSLITGIVVNLINLVIPGLHVNQILIGDIMVLIPGIPITNSIRYILSGDLISSFEKLMDSLMQAFGIAAGFMLSLLVIKGNLVDASATYHTWERVVQLVAAALGTLGFCLIFNLRKKYIAVSTVGGFLCWGIFLLLQGHGLSIFVSTLITAVLVGMYGELFAYLLKVPTTILFTLACVPLIPGKNLYYSVLAIISSNWADFTSNIVLLILYAVGIALGLAMVVELEQITKRGKV